MSGSERQQKKTRVIQYRALDDLRFPASGSSNRSLLPQDRISLVESRKVRSLHSQSFFSDFSNLVEFLSRSKKKKALAGSPYSSSTMQSKAVTITWSLESFSSLTSHRHGSEQS